MVPYYVHSALGRCGARTRTPSYAQVGRVAHWLALCVEQAAVQDRQVRKKVATTCVANMLYWRQRAVITAWAALAEDLRAARSVKRAFKACKRVPCAHLQMMTQ